MLPIPATHFTAKASRLESEHSQKQTDPHWPRDAARERVDVRESVTTLAIDDAGHGQPRFQPEDFFGDLMAGDGVWRQGRDMWRQADARM